MNTSFKITAIEENFEHLFDMTENELKKTGGMRMVVDAQPGFPCRVSLEDAEIGEEVILFPYQHHKTASPYQASGPIFVRKNVKVADLEPNKIPEMLVHRLQSLRVYDTNGMMIAAKTLEGNVLRKEIHLIFANELAHYIHIHNANPGCYNCQVNRM